MANDEEWVADVKRWCLAGAPSASSGEAPLGEPVDEVVGYEAADPALQARYWPDVSTTGR